MARRESVTMWAVAPTGNSSWSSEVIAKYLGEEAIERAHEREMCADGVVRSYYVLKWAELKSLWGSRRDKGVSFEVLKSENGGRFKPFDIGIILGKRARHAKLRKRRVRQGVPLSPQRSLPFSESARR